MIQEINCEFIEEPVNPSKNIITQKPNIKELTIDISDDIAKLKEEIKKENKKRDKEDIVTGFFAIITLIIAIAMLFTAMYSSSTKTGFLSLLFFLLVCICAIILATNQTTYQLDFESRGALKDAENFQCILQNEIDFTYPVKIIIKKNESYFSYVEKNTKIIKELSFGKLGIQKIEEYMGENLRLEALLTKEKEEEVFVFRLLVPNIS